MFKGPTANHCIGECGGILDLLLVTQVIPQVVL